MKKIAIILERADITLGGAERSVLELASALSAGDFDVHAVAANGQADVKNIHILCPRPNAKRSCLYTFEKELKEHLAENHYDIIHSVLPFDFADVYQPRGGTYAESILRSTASYQNNFLQIYKRLTAFANRRRTPLLKAEKKLCLNSNGPIVAALSQYVAEQFKRHYNLSDNRLVVIPNGVKVNKQAVDISEAEKLRKQILIEANISNADNPIFLLFAANNFRLKGLAVLIKALNLVQRQNKAKNVRLIVVGKDNTCKYRHLSKKLSVLEKIVFLGSVRNIQNVLSISDVAVLPTFYDPSSRFTLESLAADKPVITTKYNGATDLFVDSRHGKVIDPDNILALAEAIVYFSNSENIKKASKAIIEDNLKEKISIQRVVEQLSSLYESILKRKQK